MARPRRDIAFAGTIAIAIATIAVLGSPPASTQHQSLRSAGFQPAGMPPAPLAKPRRLAAAQTIKGVSTTGFVLTIDGGTFTVRCRHTTLDAAMEKTRAGARVTRIAVGNGQPHDCAADASGLPGYVAGSPVSIHDRLKDVASVPAPWPLRLGAKEALTSIPGIVGMRESFGLTVTIQGTLCRLTIPPQPMGVVLTSKSTTMLIGDDMVMTESTGHFGCPQDGLATLNAVYALRTASHMP